MLDLPDTDATNGGDAEPVLLVIHASEVLAQLARRLLSVGVVTLDDVREVLPSFVPADA